MSDLKFRCLWERECPLAGLCKRVADDSRVSMAPDRLGEKCPYYIPKDEEAKDAAVSS